MSEIYHIRTISEVHQQLGLPKPKHPLISVITDFHGSQNIDFEGVRFTTDLYSMNQDIIREYKKGKAAYQIWLAKQ